MQKDSFLGWISRYRWLFLGGLFLYLATALSNVGIIASDDYEFGIARIVPAQNWNFSSIIEASGIRSPIPNLFLFTFTNLAYQLGVLDPVVQLKFALFFIALMTFSLNSYFCYRFFKISEEKSKILLFLFGFYFICPMIFTRPLIENLSAPFLLGSAFFACAYAENLKAKDLVLSVLFLTLSAVFRFQVGVCGLGLLFVVLSKRKLSHLPVLALAGIAGYVLSGLVDWIYKGGLHASLFAYTQYQKDNIHRFGAQPVYVFLALFIGLSFPPALFQKYKNFNWKKEYEFLKPALLYFVIFIAAHSIVVHKEERFMVPVLPIFFALVTPLALYTLKHSKWRVRYFLALNLVLLPFASFNTPQNNLISAARFVHQNPKITRVSDLGDCLFNFPVAFISHPVLKDVISSDEVQKGTPLTCDRVFIVRQDIREGILGVTENYVHLGTFKPGLPEQWVIALNPKQNRRRGPLEIYGSKDCWP